LRISELCVFNDIKSRALIQKCGGGPALKAGTEA
jgi:hypothetical protein